MNPLTINEVDSGVGQMKNHLRWLSDANHLGVMTGSQMNGIDGTDSSSNADWKCWAIADGKAGHQSQVRGLAEAIGAEFELFDCRVRFPWNFAPSALVPLKPDSFRFTESVATDASPEIIISCGRQAALGALALKRTFGESVLLVHLQNPQASRKTFDLIVTPEHDNLQGPNVVSTIGAMHSLTLEKLQEAARRGAVAGLENLTARFVAVLLGGPNKYYAFDDGDILRLSDHLQQIASDKLQLAIIPSRRTPAKAISKLRQSFGGDHFVWDRTGENPYLSALALCSYCLVTSDSVSMISEATATGQPVYVEMLNEKRPAKKFHQFHTGMIERGYVKKFIGNLEDWAYEPPNEAKRIAKIIQERLLKE